MASRFAYDTRYIDCPDTFEIDPVRLGLKDRLRVRGQEIFPINQLTQFGGIRDAAPDVWGRRAIEAQRRVPVNSLSEADYLLGAGLVEHRLPFVSGLILVACDEFESRLKGYRDLAQAVREHVHPCQIRANSEELFGRMVFNIFVSNDDDHLRNHGFVCDPRWPGWSLSLRYDVVPRPGVAFERQLHLQVGTQGKVTTLDNAMSAYSAFTPQRTIAIIRRIWGELRQWSSAFEDSGASGRLIDQLAPALRDLDDICSPALQTEIRKA